MTTLRERLIQLARAKPLAPDTIEALGGNARSGIIPVSSSWIRSLRYRPEQGITMRVSKTGKDYPYPGFGLAEFKRWIQSTSKGKWWHRNVRERMENSTFPIQNSRWTGPTHPMFADPSVDGPAQIGKFTGAAGAGKHTELLAWLKSQISPQATHQHLAALTGWLPGTTLNYYWQNKTSNIAKTLATEVSDPHGLYSAHRTIHASGNNDPPHIENDLISIPRDPHNPYRGTSGSLLLRQIRAAYEMGIPSINWFSAYDEPGEAAARRAPTTNLLQQFFPALAALPQHNDDEFTGGLTWPLMGADGILPPRYIKSVPREIVDEAQHMSQGRFINSQKISDFFASPTARDYYLAHPTAHDGFVDTTPGSYSRRAIEYHVSKNAVQRGMAPAIPDAQMPKKPLHLERRRYAPHIEHLLQTGELHPDYFDEYFTAR